MAKTSRWRNLLLNRRSHQESRDSTAGRVAEEYLEKEILKLTADTQIEVHRGIRIPDIESGRRREVDFFITLPNKVLVVEMKNWAGQVLLRDDSFIQLRSHHPREIDHGPLFDTLYRKGWLLEDHHKKQTGLDPPPFEYRLIFHNPSLVLDKRLKGRPELRSTKQVVDEVAREIGRQSSSRLPLFSRGKRNQGEDISEEIKALNKTIHQLGTWDEVHMNGGATLIGDIHEASLEDSGFPSLSDRKNISEVQLKVPRSLLWLVVGLPKMKAKTVGRGAECLESGEVKVEATLECFPAGAERPKLVPLREIESFSYGYPVRFDDEPSRFT